MSQTFKCRIPERDGEQWYDVAEAHYDEMAARMYAEDEDSNSAMELFQDDATVIVEVKDEAGVVTKFSVTREFTPMYCTAALDRKPEPVSDIPV